MVENDPHERWRTRSTAAAFRHAGDGILYALRTQRHMPHYFVLIFLVLLSGIYLRLRPLEILFAMSAITLVLLAEMLNTAIETLVDILCPEFDDRAKVAKDTACAAVFVACCYALSVLVVIYFNADRLTEMALGSFADRPVAPVEAWVVGLIVLCLAVALAKWRGGRGTLMRGGIVSGHAAIAFFLATSLVFAIDPPTWAVPGFLIALLVAQSRVDGHIHSLREVIAGSIVGLVVGVLVHHMGGVRPI
jgi:diacylglycerol kinase (ATP)